MKIYENMVDVLVVNDKYKFRMPISGIRFNDTWFCYDLLSRDRQIRDKHLKNMFDEDCTDDLFLNIAAYLFCGLEIIERLIDDENI